MKNNPLTYFAAILLMALTPLPALADWSKPYEVSFIMGDGDNRSSARQAALDQIKLKASDEAGTYIQSTTTMHESGDLTETIQMVGASMVGVIELEENLTVNSSGQAVLWVKATATLDENELKRRVAELQHDKSIARQVDVLQSENAALRMELANIRHSLSSKADPAKTAELLALQNTTLQRIEENGRTVSQVFGRGALIQMASNNSAELDNVKRELEDKFIAQLLQMRVTAKIESVEGSGNDYTALVRVGWQIDTMKIRPVLKRYLRVNGFNGNLDIYRSENTAGQGPTSISEQVFEYLATKKVDLKLLVAGKEVRLPVLYATNSFPGVCDVYSSTQRDSAKAKYVCLVSQESSSSELRSPNGHTSNPVRIHLTKDEAERATHVDASLVAFDVAKSDSSRK